MRNLDALDFDIYNGESGFCSQKIKEQVADQLRLENIFLERPKGESFKNEIDLDTIDLDALNERYIKDIDAYYRIPYGLSSRIIAYSKGTFTLEVVIGGKWSKDFNTTVQELAYLWRNTSPELKNSIGCKAYIIDTKTCEYKKDLIKGNINPDYDAKKGIIFRKGYLN